jgi:hypothetical protein
MRLSRRRIFSAASAKFAVPAVLVLVGIAGCGGGSTTGEVSGAFTVDGQPPAAGSSITFIPTDGKSPTAGATISGSTYSAQVPVGISKVEIRAPRPARRAASSTGGPGPGSSGGLIEESLPAKYNDQSELTIDVKRGSNPKDWNLSTK